MMCCESNGAGRHTTSARFSETGAGVSCPGAVPPFDDEEELRAGVREEQLQFQIERDGEATVRLPHRFVDVQQEQFALEIQRVERIGLRRSREPIPEPSIASRVAERIVARQRSAVSPRSMPQGFPFRQPWSCQTPTFSWQSMTEKRRKGVATSSSSARRRE